MKKVFLLMFAILASIVPGWADKVTDLSQLDNDKVYVLRSERAFLLYSDKLPAQLCSSTGKVIGSVTASLTDPTQQFRIEKNGGNYYLFSVGAQKYVSSNGNYEANASTPLTIQQVNNASYPWKLSLNGNELNSQNSGQMDAGITVSNWDTPDAGNCYYIEEAIPEDKVYTVVVLGTEDPAAGFTYGGQEYKNSATIETNDVIKASDVQADMLKQIEAGIEQISSVVQSNSAAAEETSAISEELSAQAISLKDMVDAFELRQD